MKLTNKSASMLRRTLAGRSRPRRRNQVLLKSALRNILPDEVLDRPKMGFGVPLGHWLRTSLKEVLLDTVLSQRALSRGYFRPEAIREMVETHLAGRDQFKYLLWDLLMLEEWHRTFIDQPPLTRRWLVGNAHAQ